MRTTLVTDAQLRAKKRSSTDFSIELYYSNFYFGVVAKPRNAEDEKEKRTDLVIRF